MTVTPVGPDVVVKVGGSLLRQPTALDAVGHALVEWADASRSTTDIARFVVVPGGGPFADAIRLIDRRHRLGDDASHWLAVLAMNQYGELLASRWPRAIPIDDPTLAVEQAGEGRVPILVPYRTLRARDPLPHSWDVTSDSIAAWLAFDLGAKTLILVKPAAGSTKEMTDSHFECLMSQAASERRDLTVRVCSAEGFEAGWRSMAQMPAARCCCRAG